MLSIRILVFFFLSTVAIPAYADMNAELRGSAEKGDIAAIEVLTLSKIHGK